MVTLKLPHVNLRKNGRLLGFGSSAKRDWKIIFYASAAVFALFICIGLYMFFIIGRGDVAGTPMASTEGPVNVDSLTKVTKYYAAKASALQDIEKTKDATPDPSI